MTKQSIITPSATQKIAKNLNIFLANTFVVYVKTLNFHWNVIDPRFYSLHKMFEGQYEELASAIDDIAERIRGLQTLSAGSMKTFLELATLKESPTNISGNEMIETLLHDHETLCNEIRPLIEALQSFGDEGGADFLTERLRVHEKTAWMLRSHLA